MQVEGLETAAALTTSKKKSFTNSKNNKGKSPHVSNLMNTPAKNEDTFSQALQIDTSQKVFEDKKYSNTALKS
jgi:hypothetical protein